MRRQELVQLLQFIIARVVVGLFVVFVLEQPFIDFVLKYWFYLLIVSVSYFYYYSIQYEPDKKYQFIRKLVIYGNVYLFLHIFFRPQLNISHQLFVLLGLIILGIGWTTKLKTRWKYLLQILGGIFSFFILISGIFYLYPKAPDVDGFIKGRDVEIMVLGVSGAVSKNDAYIQIRDNRGVSDYEIHPEFSRVLSENMDISYPSLHKLRDEKVIILTPQGDLFWIFPQSEIQLEFSGSDLKKVSEINGKIGFLSGVFESNVEFSGGKRYLGAEQIAWLSGVQNTYKHDLVLYLKRQISESNISWANNTIMYNIDGKIVKVLSRMFPATFSKNWNNYNEFQKYFSWVDEGVELGRYYEIQGSGESMGSLWGMIKDNIDIGKNNTYGIRKPIKLEDRF